MTEEETYCLTHAFNAASDFIQDSQLIRTMITEEEACDIASTMVSFQNANLVAYNLAFNAPDTATALFEELLYYRKMGRI